MMNRGQARALVERQAQAWENGDVVALLADFALDGVLIAPSGRWQGHDALRAAAESVFATTTDRRITITRILLDGDHGVVEWTWSETRPADGRRYSVEDAIIFVVRDEQIVSWREYFDTAAFAALA
jgi:uncharacterized protein (TIGR02246 family)